jgi:hypothetical protein
MYFKPAYIFRNKKQEYLKAKIDKLENNRKLKETDKYIEASVTLKRVTSVELIEYFSRMEEPFLSVIVYLLG